MPIVLIEPRGFCRGVRQALELLDRALQENPVYVLNEIVHNKTIIAAYQQKGACFVQNIQDAPPGSRIVFSAHGVPPETRREAIQRGLKIIDATCPLVQKVHAEAIEFTRRHIPIIYLGHKNHEEVRGVCGEAPQNITLIESIDDIQLIPRGRRQYAVLTQTTLNIEDTQKIIAALKKDFQIIEPKQKDICYATAARQEAVRKTAPQVEAVLIIGSQNSSNSIRLKEIAEAAGAKAYLADSYRDLPADIKKYKSIGITAGASAPEYLVQECLAYLA
ncbi:4-hydroxy-3-methylbut-2-enyl diphosphate reductase [Candidatus Termititenax persephonae]|uniref:4-hydroxy-3-methylbut-2-enyl diphosphate reductase n=1 Tax=Candidatus Termititenax persephonae TaxID=2218525 RepID=A0A388TID7_9BACT|nr:4-hydroxy-3-methylbut-2-enyl diphosphate reductase [Candidatus Termititenax persephonae]